jgi:hypothetical protein
VNWIFCCTCNDGKAWFLVLASWDYTLSATPYLGKLDSCNSSLINQLCLSFLVFFLRVSFLVNGKWYQGIVDYSTLLHTKTNFTPGIFTPSDELANEVTAASEISGE